eukprot:5667373-Pleurochrysis_carterae.AAC.1
MRERGKEGGGPVDGGSQQGSRGKRVRGDGRSSRAEAVEVAETAEVAEAAEGGEAVMLLTAS